MIKERNVENKSNINKITIKSNEYYKTFCQPQK